MRYQVAILLLVIGVGVGAVLAVPAVPANEQTKIQELIGQLGSDNFRQRDAATKELDAIGEPALEALRKAAKNSDMEVANRAAALIAKIEQRAETARLIAPTYVELSFKETPIEEAVAELAKKSGYSIVIGGDKTKMADRRVTLETGKVPFWKALDLLCEKAGLVEGDGNVAVQGGDSSLQPAVPQIQVRPLPAQIKPINVKPVQIKPVPKAEKEEKPVDPKPDQPKPVEKPNLPQGFSADDKADELKKAEEARRQADEEAQKKAQEAEAAKRAQIQAQIQLQAQQIQRFPSGGRQPVGQGSTIVLIDGKSALPSSTESAIRVRSIGSNHPQYNQSPVPDGEVSVQLEVRAEPKLQVQQILGVKIDKAIDNYDQLLTQMAIANTAQPAADDLQLQQGQLKLRILQQQGYIAAPVGLGQTVFPVRLKKSDKSSKSIKELRGEVSLKIRTPVEELAAIENVLKAKGESIKGKNGTSLKIVDVEKLANGDVKVVVEVQYPTEITPINNSTANPALLLNGLQIQGQIQVQIAPVPPKGGGGDNRPASTGTTYAGLQLLDDKGTPVTMAQVQSGRTTANQAGRTVNATLIFRPSKDQEPAKLAFKGTRLATVDVPFFIKDVPLK